MPAADRDPQQAHGLILSIQKSRPDGRLIEETFRQDADNIDIVTMYAPEAALAYLSDADNRVPDLILAAARFPNMTTVELLHAIKSQARLRATPVLILGSYLVAQEIEELYTEQASSMIELPGRLADLEKTVRLIKAYWLGIAGLPLQRQAVRPQLAGQ